MDTQIVKIRGSWLIVNGKRVWIRKIAELPEEEE